MTKPANYPLARKNPNEQALDEWIMDTFGVSESDAREACAALSRNAFAQLINFKAVEGYSYYELESFADFFAKSGLTRKLKEARA